MPPLYYLGIAIVIASGFLLIRIANTPFKPKS